MYTLAVQTITAGATVAIDAGTANTVGAVVLYNESPNLVRVTWGSSSDWLPAWTGDCFYMNQNTGFNGTFQLTGQAISSAGNAPSSVVAGKVYAPGEQVSGTYPTPLVRQTNVGNSTLPTTSSSSVINDGNTAGTTVVEGTPQGAPSSQLLLNNDGSGLLGGGAIAISSVGQLTGASLAQLSSDGGTITSDGSGNLSAQTLASAGSMTAHALASIILAASSAGNTDTLILQRTGAFGTGEFVVGLDTTGSLYIFDVGHGAFVVQAISATKPLPRMDGASGTPGHVIWSGTTDPGAAAGEGDIWVKA